MTQLRNWRRTTTSLWISFRIIGRGASGIDSYIIYSEGLGSLCLRSGMVSCCIAAYIEYRLPEKRILCKSQRVQIQLRNILPLNPFLHSSNSAQVAKASFSIPVFDGLQEMQCIQRPRSSPPFPRNSRPSRCCSPLPQAFVIV
jgi:hypothetical protein